MLGQYTNAGIKHLQLHRHASPTMSHIDSVRVVGIVLVWADQDSPQ